MNKLNAIIIHIHFVIPTINKNKIEELFNKINENGKNNHDLLINNKRNIKENMILKIGILANPEPINEIYNSTDIVNKGRKGIFNSTIINWMNNSINSEIVLDNIKNFFEVQNNIKIDIEFVPLLFWQNDSQVDEILSKINAVIFIGGMRNLDFKNEWENYSIRLLRKIMILQENNRKIPVWGICQGFQFIQAILVNSTEILENFSSWNQMQNIQIKKTSELKNKNISIYRYLNKKEIQFLNKEKSTVHYHNLGLSPNSYENKKYSILKRLFQISAIGSDKEGKNFINSVESFPPYNIFGQQYHPEKKPIKVTRNLKGSNNEYLRKFNIVNSKILINYLIKALEDFIINNEKAADNSKTNEFNDKDDYLNKIKINSENIVYDFNGSPVPTYLFSE